MLFYWFSNNFFCSEVACWIRCIVKHNILDKRNTPGHFCQVVFFLFVGYSLGWSRIHFNLFHALNSQILNLLRKMRIGEFLCWNVKYISNWLSNYRSIVSISHSKWHPICHDCHILTSQIPNAARPFCHLRYRFFLHTRKKTRYFAFVLILHFSLKWNAFHAVNRSMIRCNKRMWWHT